MVNDNESYEDRMRPPKYPKLWNRAWLTEQYVGNKRSIRDIANEVGCFWYSVKNALVKLGIKRRKYTMTDQALVARLRGGKSMRTKKLRGQNEKENKAVADGGDKSI